jgi:hypothetical protein
MVIASSGAHLTKKYAFTIAQDARTVDVVDCMDKLLGPGALPSHQRRYSMTENCVDEKSSFQISAARDAAREQSPQTSIPDQAPWHCFHCFNMNSCTASPNQYLIDDQRAQ